MTTLGLGVNLRTGLLLLTLTLAKCQDYTILDDNDVLYWDRIEAVDVHSQQLLGTLCENYDMTLNDQSIDCSSIQLKPKKSFWEVNEEILVDHNIDKREVEEPLLEGSGDGNIYLAPLGDVADPPKGDEPVPTLYNGELKEPENKPAEEVGVKENESDAPAPEAEDNKEPAPEPQPDAPAPPEPAPEEPPTDEQPTGEEQAAEGAPIAEQQPVGVEPPTPENPVEKEEPEPLLPIEQAEESVPQEPAPAEQPTGDEQPEELSVPEEPVEEAPVEPLPAPEGPSGGEGSAVDPEESSAPKELSVSEEAPLPAPEGPSSGEGSTVELEEPLPSVEAPVEPLSAPEGPSGGEGSAVDPEESSAPKELSVSAEAPLPAPEGPSGGEESAVDPEESSAPKELSVSAEAPLPAPEGPSGGEESAVDPEESSAPKDLSVSAEAPLLAPEEPSGGEGSTAKLEEPVPSVEAPVEPLTGPEGPSEEGEPPVVPKIENVAGDTPQDNESPTNTEDQPLVGETETESASEGAEKPILSFGVSSLNTSQNKQEETPRSETTVAPQASDKDTPTSEDKPKEKETVDEKQSGVADLVNEPSVSHPSSVEGSDTDKIVSALSPKQETVKTIDSSEQPKAAESAKDVSTRGKDATVLIVLFVVVLVIGAAAFTHHFIKKRRASNENSSINGITKELESPKNGDVEQGVEMKPLLNSNNKPIIIKEYSDKKNDEA